MKSLCDSGGFMISYMAQYAKLPFNSISLASSEDYLYLYISCTNGAMLKIGTGELGTNAGEVYLAEPVKKTEEICWVYMRHKLYLKSHAKEVIY